MDFYRAILLLIIVFTGCQSPQGEETNTDEREQDTLSRVVTVAEFKGQQVTGVTVTAEGRIFANFPRWRKGVQYSVVEINPETGEAAPFPFDDMNDWEIGQKMTDSVFVAVQSVVASEGKLYALDTRNPQFRGVTTEPRIFVFDLFDDKLENIIRIDAGVVENKSYTNDLRIHEEENKIYITDSHAAGLIVVDMNTGESRRVLDGHSSTTAEFDQLIIDGKKWRGGPVHSDGIALDKERDSLYFHALTGYNLYVIETGKLSEPDSVIEDCVKLVRRTSAPDGMILDDGGNLYYADLEQHKINYLTPAGEVRTLVEGDQVRWADTFSIYNGWLYYTNSRIHEVSGDISDMTFSINKVRLPDKPRDKSAMK